MKQGSKNGTKKGLFISTTEAAEVVDLQGKKNGVLTSGDPTRHMRLKIH